MQNRLTSPLVVLLRETVIKATVTVANATGIWTSNAHGLVNGDVVLISNSGGAIPAGSSATTKYFVKKINANTFYLYTDSEFKTILAVTDDGSGTNSFNLQCRILNVEDYLNLEIEADTSNSANFVLSCQASNEENCPNFYQTQSTTNIWKYIQMKDLATATGVNGSSTTGIAPTGTDIHTSYEVNTNGLRWLTFTFSSFTAGKIRLGAKAYGNI